MAEQVGWWDVAPFPSSLTGLVGNHQLAKLVERERKGKRIEELSILLSAVAASCAVPVLFEPVEVGGRYLVDGALTEAQILDSDLAIRLDVHDLMHPKPFADALISAGEQAFAEIWPALKRWMV